MNTIYAWTDIQFWLYWLLFGLVFGFTIMIPGYVALALTGLNSVKRWLLAPIVGISLWGLQGFLIGSFLPREFSYLYCAIFIFLFFWRFFPKKLRFFNLYQNLSKVFVKIWQSLPFTGWVLVIVGSLLQLLSVFGSGFNHPQGITFYWLNSFDGMLHLTFIEELAQHFPPIQPGAWPLAITNYHYWSDLILADQVRLWGLPTAHLYFHYWPVVLAPLTGLIVFNLVKQWTKSVTAALWAVFFHYFAGDLMYVFLWWWRGTLGEHTMTLDNGIIQLLNMPQAFAKLIFLGGLMLFDHWQKSQRLAIGWLTGLVLATTVGFKVYFGILAATGLGLFALVDCLIHLKTAFARKNWLDRWRFWWKTSWPTLSVLILAGLVAAAIFFPVNQHAGGLFWAPLDWPKLLLGADKLNWNEWWLRLQVYEAANNTRALIVWYSLAVIVFMLAIYGTRLIGWLYPRRLLKLIGWHNFIFLYPGTLLFTFIGMNFLQVSGLHNIFNFFVIALSVLSLLTAVILADRLPKNWLGKLLILVVVGLTIPRVLLTGWFYLVSYWRGFEAQTITPADQEAMRFISALPEDVRLQTHPNNFLDSYSPYLYFFTHRYSYYGGRGVLNSHNQPVKDRKVLVDQLFATKIPVEAEALMKEAGITHLIYQPQFPSQSQRLNLNYPDMTTRIKVVFENEAFRILEYQDK